MAGNYYRDRIGSIRQAHCTRCVRVSDTFREFAVRGRTAVRDFEQLSPDLLLKRSTLGRDREVEVIEFSGKIGSKLLDRFTRCLGIFFPIGIWRGRVPVLHEVDLA